MYREDRDEAVVYCVDCGALIQPGFERGYPYGSLGLVCWDCSLRRGGTYDWREDCWSRAPDLTGIRGDRLLMD
jgi:hypothetical protein